MICPICKKVVNAKDDKYIVHYNGEISIICHEKCVDDMVIDFFIDYGAEAEENDFWRSYAEAERRRYDD